MKEFPEKLYVYINQDQTGADYLAYDKYEDGEKGDVIAVYVKQGIFRIEKETKTSLVPLHRI